MFGYTNVVDDYDERVTAAGHSDSLELVESFGFVDNLMCEGVVRRSGSEVVRYQASPADRATALDGFERCVLQAAQHSFEP